MSMPDLEERLSASLHARADALPETPLTLHGVQRRAGTIRRRRLVAAAGVAAAAVLLPVALLATPGADRAAPQPVAPSPVEVTPDDARAGGEGLDVTDLPRGDAPGIGYLDRAGGTPTVVRPDGRRVPLDVPGTVHGFATMADGSHAVVAGGEGGERLVSVDAEGRARRSFARAGGVALSPDRTQVAFAAPDGAVRVWTQGATGPRTLGVLPEGSSVVAMAGECVWDAPPDATGCRVVADVPGEGGTSLGWVVSSTGEDGPLPSGSGAGSAPILSVADVATAGVAGSQEPGGLVAGITEVRLDGTCSGVHDSRPGAGWSAETCEHRFGSFSPDATRVLAWEAYGDGLGHPQVGMYDVASGELLWDRVSSAPGTAFLHSATWEDADDLLAPAYQDGEWHLVRLGADGSMELAAEPVAGEETQPAHLPEIQP